MAKRVITHADNIWRLCFTKLFVHRHLQLLLFICFVSLSLCKLLQLVMVWQQRSNDGLRQPKTRIPELRVAQLLSIVLC